MQAVPPAKEGFDIARFRLRFGIRCLLILIAIAGFLMLPLMAWRRAHEFAVQARYQARLEFAYKQSAVSNISLRENPSLGLPKLVLSDADKKLQNEVFDSDDYRILSEAGVDITKTNVS